MMMNNTGLRFLTKKLVLSAIAVMALGSASAYAQSAPMYFYPTDAWQIEQNTKNCRISNIYNNGFILTVKAQKGASPSFPADLLVNFRQPAFTPQTVYKVTLQFDEASAPVTLDAMAVDAETLSLPITRHPRLLRSLMNAPTVNVRMSLNNFNFSLVGLKQHKDSFKTCLDSSYIRTKQANIRETEAVPTAEIKQRKRNLPLDPMSKDLSPASDSPKSLIGAPSKKPEASAARAPEKISDLYKDEDFEPSLPVLNGADWNLEKATMRFQEAERQLKSLGKKLKAERIQCSAEKRELEALLFDPQLTSEQQLSKLNSLEEQLRRKEVEIQNIELRYQERIKILEQQLNSF